MKRKELIWVASSKKDLKKFPEDVQDTMGYGLLDAQEGKKHEKAKPLQGFGGADILEIIDEDQSGTYRTVYAVRFKEVVFVLHAFQKKSKQGIETPQQEIELIKNRLKQALEEYNELYKKK
jgi:phage-related protein